MQCWNWAVVAREQASAGARCTLEGMGKCQALTWLGPKAYAKGWYTSVDKTLHTGTDLTVWTQLGVRAAQQHQQQRPSRSLT